MVNKAVTKRGGGGGKKRNEEPIHQSAIPAPPPRQSTPAGGFQTGTSPDEERSLDHFRLTENTNRPVVVPQQLPVKLRGPRTCATEEKKKGGCWRGLVGYWHFPP